MPLAISLVLWHLGILTLPAPILASVIPLGRGVAHSNPTSSHLEPRSSLQATATTSTSQLTRVNLSQTLWSSIFLVFSLAWIAIHPNFSSPYDSAWMKVRRRLMLVIWAILFPELVLYWSVRQWVGARKIRARFREKGWTLTDAHFLQMGGLLLATVHREGPEGKTRFFTLTVPILDALYKQHAPHTPSTRSADIQGQALQTTTPVVESETSADRSEHSPESSTPKSFSSSAEKTPPRSRIPLSLEDIDKLAPPPDSIEDAPPARPLPSSLADIDNFAPPPDSIEDKPPARLPFSLADIENFAPPPDCIKEAPPPPPNPDPRPRAPPEALNPIPSVAALAVLTSIHLNLPSCLPPWPSSPPHNVEPILATKPLFPRGRFTTTFPADPLLALIVLLQLVWYLSSCLARIATGGWRELLLVEVVVLSYVSMYLVMIGVWWHKPVIGLGGEPAKIPILNETRGKESCKETKREVEVSKEKEGSISSSARHKGKGVDRSGWQEEGPVLESHTQEWEDALNLYTSASSTYGSSQSRMLGAAGVATPPGSSNPEMRVSRRTAAESQASKEEDTASVAYTDLSDDNAFNPLGSSFKEIILKMQFTLLFSFDRVHEFFLKTTGYDDSSREHEISTRQNYSNFTRSERARVRRERARHSRRWDTNTSRLGLDEYEVRLVSMVVGGHGHPAQLRTHPAKHYDGKDQGISESVKRRREAGSGGHSRLPTFYAYVTKRGYHSAEEIKLKILVGAVCGLLLGGILLLGLAYRELPAASVEALSSNSLFAKTSPSFAPRVLYLVCSLILTVVPFLFSLCALRMSEPRAGVERLEEETVSFWILEMLGLPFALLYIPAKIGVIVVAILQLVRRARAGMNGDLVEIAMAFDGVNPSGAWWLSFLPHFS